MKPQFSHALDFSLPCEGGTFQLQDLESKNRVALLFPCDEQQARDAIGRVEANIAGWNERDLVLVLVLPDDRGLFDLQKTSAAVFITCDDRGEVARQFGAMKNETAFFLLGKSRFPVALAVNYVPDDAEIFALIDAMPMRRREMHEQQMRQA